MCPHCGDSSESKVTETRKGPEAIYRRRKCGGCSRAFVTKESHFEKMPAQLNRRKKAGEATEGVGTKFLNVSNSVFSVWG